ncbi:hypothetical protein [Streptomyces microflavus]|uniref:hypothetical protein n=1 Tax=Streptomyces microflavus TaxID=1919 RepID=UPI0033E87503
MSTSRGRTSSPPDDPPSAAPSGSADPPAARCPPPPGGRPHEHPRPRRARLLAAGYIGLVTATALAHEIAGQPEGGRIPLTLATFPGGIALLVLIHLPAPLTRGGPGTEETGFSLLAPLSHGAGALLNVLIVWGVIAFARHFRAESRRSRSR